MVRLLAAGGAGRIVLLDVAEQPLFRIHAELTAQGYGDGCVPVLGSACHAGLLRSLFEEYQPELVLHAAALKHVPLMERNPLAALETNALGAWRLAHAAQKHGASAMILVSTDKAVAPHSIMGAAKRLAELALLAQADRGGMRCAAVRLVNVIGSPCSVGPLFEEQIASGGPVTLTHPGAKRYFMTLADVALLLAEAMDSDTAEGVLVPDPGEALCIVDLAKRMMKAARRTVPMVFAGLRPGDKLDESLMRENERDGGPATVGLRRVDSPVPRNLETHMGELESAIAARDLVNAQRIVLDLVPDYQPSVLLRESLAEMAQP
jgi:FlaA1/EpsC-like NDP-sugar epimerase